MSQSKSEWDWMVAMAKASNSGDKQAVSRIICDAPLAEMPRLQHMAISVFEITKENVSTYPDAAERLAELEDDGTWDARAAFRPSLIKEQSSMLLSGSDPG